ncbi:MAG: hypothetical protein M1375_04470 [Candidatus Thermoplasmatota archaeon]|nr:hypothetical protein [Candidatus Thermoplasmatota archaeon]MCL5791207.1 hypothetical protein [Candidatus Thermoplasmatota archaeon]
MNRLDRLSIISFFISFFLFAEFSFTGIFLNVFIIHTYAKPFMESILLMLAGFMLLSFLLNFRSSIMAFYVSLYTSLAMFLTVIFTIGETSFIIVLMAFLLYIIYAGLNFRKIDGKRVRITTFFATLALIGFLGGIISIYQQPYRLPITIETASTLFIGVGHSLPILEEYGIFVISPYLELTVSPVELLIFLGISSLVSENYYLIIKYIGERRSSSGKIGAALYGVTGALSCQCESYIALLPAISAFLLDEVLLPTVFSSIALLILTYIFVSRFYMQGRHIRLFEPAKWGRRNRWEFIFLSSSLILPPLIVTAGVSMNLERNPIFFFLSGMYMVLEGYIFTYSVFRFIRPKMRSRRVNIIVTSSGIILPLLWYIPFLTGLAFNNGLIYDIMSLSGFFGGIMMGYSFTHSTRSEAYAINEYITVIFSIFPLAIFYLGNVLEIRIWSFFSLEGQIIFSLINWLIMLPIMWFATHVSLQNLVDGSISKSGDVDGIKFIDSGPTLFQSRS